MSRRVLAPTQPERSSFTITPEEARYFMRHEILRVPLVYWQEQYLHDCYEVDPSTGLQFCTRALISVPRKNGKTSLVNGQLVMHLVHEDCGSGQVILTVSPTHALGKESFEIILQIIRENTEISNLLEVGSATGSSRWIRDPVGFNRLQAVTASRRATQSFKGDIIYLDEVADMNYEVYSSLKIGQRTQHGASKLLIMTSTMNTDPGNTLQRIIHDSENMEKRRAKRGLHSNWAKVIMRGRMYTQQDVNVRNERLRRLRFAAGYAEENDDGELVLDKEKYPDLILKDLLYNRKRNVDPINEVANLYDPTAIDELIDEAYVSEEAHHEMMTYVLNMNSGDSYAFIPYDVWARRAEDDLTIEKVMKEFKGKLRCYMGMDLSKSVALTALAYWFPDVGALFCDFWIPRESVARQTHADRQPYQKWIDQGYIKESIGETIQYSDVLAKIYEANSKFNVVNLRYDNWKIDTLLAEHGKAVATWDSTKAAYKPILPELIDIRMGVSMGPLMRDFEYSVRNMKEKFRHSNNPVLNNHINNLVAVQQSNVKKEAIKPDKRSAKCHNDGAIASLLAFRAPSQKERKVREQPKSLRHAMPAAHLY